MAKSKNPAGGGTPVGGGSLDTELSGSSPNNTKSNVSGATTANALPPTTVRTAALEHARRGWPVFPCDPSTKKPLTRHGFKDAAADTNIITNWWQRWPDAMIGVPTGARSGFWAVDPDAPDKPSEPDGMAAWKTLINLNGAPKTRTHSTPGGGEHWLFRWHPDKPIRNGSGDLPPGIHVRGEGGYIIVPPSRRPDGKAYAVIDHADLAEAPPWLYETILDERCEKQLPPELLAALDADAGTGLSQDPADYAPPPDRERIAAALEVTPSDDYLVWFEIGCALHRELGDGGFDLFDRWSRRSKKYNASACAKKWRECAKVSTYSAGTIFHHASRADPRWRTRLQSAKPDAPKTGTAPAHDPDIHWHGDAVTLEQRWLIRGCLPETGVAMLSGQWGLYKTFVALDLAGSVMKGEPFAGRACARKGGVLFVAAEAASSLPIRLAALAEGRFGGERLPFAWMKFSPPLRTQGSKLLIAKAQAVAKKLMADYELPLVLIVIDTLIAAADFENENDAGQGQRVMNALHGLSRATGALVVAVDHYGKELDTGTRGTSAKEGSADAVLSLLGKRDSSGRVSNARMVVRKVRDGIVGIETALRVEVVNLGLDEDGESVTSCIVHWGEPGEAPPETNKKTEAREMLTAAMAAVGERPASRRKVQDAFIKLHQARDKDAKPDSARIAFGRAVKAAIEDCELVAGPGNTLTDDPAELPL
jgi:hypothetical protein